MPWDLLKSGLDFIKLRPHHLVAIAAVLGFLLYADAEWLQLLGVRSVVEDYRPIFGVAFLFAATLLVIEVARAAFGKVNQQRRRRNFEAGIRQRLRVLTEDEKQILRFYYAENTRSNKLRFDDGVVQSLASAGVIYLASRQGNLVEGFAYNISEVAWNEIQKDPGLLDGTTNTYRTDKRW